MTGYVYMTASQKRGTIYIGVTNSLGRRIPEHKEGKGSRFTSRYGVQRLVWYEEHFDIRDAIQREKTMKHWPRQWKIELIEQTNPEWHELFRGTGWQPACAGNSQSPEHAGKGTAWVLGSSPRMTTWMGRHR